MSFLQLRELWAARQAEIVLALIGIVLVGGGVFWWRTQNSEETKIEIINGQQAQAVNETKLSIDVSGAVTRPGVYSLNSGSRVLDALEAAGGVTAAADSEWIDKYLNRSAKINDGQKIYIPGKSQKTNSDVQTSSKININAAGSGELEALPGIGPVTAGKIINGRPYNKIEELIERKITSQKIFDQIKDQISVW